MPVRHFGESIIKIADPAAPLPAHFDCDLFVHKSRKADTIYIVRSKTTRFLPSCAARTSITSPRSPHFPKPAKNLFLSNSHITSSLSTTPSPIVTYNHKNHSGGGRFFLLEIARKPCVYLCSVSLLNGSYYRAAAQCSRKTSRKRPLSLTKPPPPLFPCTPGKGVGGEGVNAFSQSNPVPISINP